MEYRRAGLRKYLQLMSRFGLSQKGEWHARLSSLLLIPIITFRNYAFQFWAGKTYDNPPRLRVASSTL
jgi:hypothetical protein